MIIMTVKEVANALKVKTSTVYAWAEQGRLPSFKLNGALRFSDEAIGAWVQTCKHPAEAYNKSRR